MGFGLFISGRLFACCCSSGKKNFGVLLGIGFDSGNCVFGGRSVSPGRAFIRLPSDLYFARFSMSLSVLILHYHRFKCGSLPNFFYVIRIPRWNDDEKHVFLSFSDRFNTVLGVVLF